jgi:hypothetical protein
MLIIVLQLNKILKTYIIPTRQLRLKKDENALMCETHVARSWVILCGTFELDEESPASLIEIKYFFKYNVFPTNLPIKNMAVKPETNYYFYLALSEIDLSPPRLHQFLPGGVLILSFHYFADLFSQRPLQNISPISVYLAKVYFQMKLTN